MHLLRKECAYLLGISTATFDRRVRAGRYGAGVKQGEGKTAERWFSYADIGLEEPKQPEPSSEEFPRTLPEPCVSESDTEPCGSDSDPESSKSNFDLPDPEPCVTEPVTEPMVGQVVRPPSAIEMREAADRAFAEAYLAGEATDSCGNTVSQTNERFPVSGQATLLGPAVKLDVPRTPRTGTLHMQPELLSDFPNPDAVANPQTGAGYTNQGWTLAAGYSREQYDRDLSDWRRRKGAPSMSQQAAKIHNDAAFIRAAFPRG